MTKKQKTMQKHSLIVGELTLSTFSLMDFPPAESGNDKKQTRNQSKTACSEDEYCLCLFRKQKHAALFVFVRFLLSPPRITFLQEHMYAYVICSVTLS